MAATSAGRLSRPARRPGRVRDLSPVSHGDDATGLLRWGRDRGRPHLDRGRRRAHRHDPAATDAAGDAARPRCRPRARCSWVRRGEGLVGWGEAARLEVTGPRALAEAAAWWADYTARLDVDDDARRPRLRAGPVRQHRLRPGRRDVGLRRPRGRGRTAGRRGLGDHGRRRDPRDVLAPPRRARRAGAPAALRRRCAGPRDLVRRRRHRRAADRRRRAGQGRARARPAGLRRRPAGPPPAAGPAGRPLPRLLDLRRRRAAGRHARAAAAAHRPAAVRPGAGRHGPARRRGRRRAAGRRAASARPRTAPSTRWRSTRWSGRCGRTAPTLNVPADPPCSPSPTCGTWPAT